MMNLKLIEKSARSKKDPSPLGSAMAMMRLKYPISIKKEKAMSYSLPTNMLFLGREGEDKHTHGRILCKKEAINWWVTKSRVPDENIVQAIRILYGPLEKEVEAYFSINWRDARIKFGQPVIERRYVPTQTPAFRMRADKELKWGDTD